jgi:hypothetical protein
VAWYISPLSLSVGDACQRSGGFGVVDPCVRFGARVARSELSEWLLGYYFLDRDINQIEFHIHYFFSTSMLMSWAFRAFFRAILETLRGLV